MNKFKFFALIGLVTPLNCLAQTADDVLVSQTLLDQLSITPALNIVLVMTLITLIPALLVVMTTFTRTIIVLSMLRHAMGMQETPPNIVLLLLAAFLTLLSMTSTFERIENQVLTPLNQQQITVADAFTESAAIMKEQMIDYTHEQDMLLIMNIAGKELPTQLDAISFVHLVPAFMLSELRLAFQIGFVIFLPFLLVDIIVSSTLMSMGMMMVPPMSIALPIKILMFVLIDGWSLVLRALLSVGL